MGEPRQKEALRGGQACFRRRQKDPPESVEESICRSDGGCFGRWVDGKLGE